MANDFFEHVLDYARITLDDAVDYLRGKKLYKGA